MQLRHLAFLLLLPASWLSAQVEGFTVAALDAVVATAVQPIRIEPTDVTLQDAPPDCAIASSPLPISTPTLFAERIDPGLVKLTWKTLRLYDGNEWRLERRLGNEGRFVPIRALSEELLNRRQLVDPNAYTARSYYRLSGISLEGETAHSRIVAVGNVTGQDHLLVYPNPSTAGPRIALPDTEHTATIAIVDGLGRAVVTRHLLARSPALLSLETVELPAGAYTISWRDAGGRQAWVRFIQL